MRKCLNIRFHGKFLKILNENFFIYSCHSENMKMYGYKRWSELLRVDNFKHILKIHWAS